MSIVLDEREVGGIYEDPSTPRDPIVVVKHVCDDYNPVRPDEKDNVGEMRETDAAGDIKMDNETKNINDDRLTICTTQLQSPTIPNPIVSSTREGNTMVFRPTINRRWKPQHQDCPQWRRCQYDNTENRKPRGTNDYNGGQGQEIVAYNDSGGDIERPQPKRARTNSNVALMVEIALSANDIYEDAISHEEPNICKRALRMNLMHINKTKPG